MSTPWVRIGTTRAAVHSSITPETAPPTVTVPALSWSTLYDRELPSGRGGCQGQKGNPEPRGVSVSAASRRELPMSGARTTTRNGPEGEPTNEEPEGTVDGSDSLTL